MDGCFPQCRITLGSFLRQNQKKKIYKTSTRFQALVTLFVQLLTDLTTRIQSTQKPETNIQGFLKVYVLHRSAFEKSTWSKNVAQ